MLKKIKRGTVPLKIFFALVFIASQSACAAGKPGYDADFPPDKYLVAEGLGQTEADASYQAKAELSRIFSSRIMSDTLDKVKATIGDGGEKVEATIESNVRVMSEVKLEGVQIGKTWYDKDGGVHHAIAVLDRRQAREGWMASVGEIDGKIEAEAAVLESTESRLLKYTSLKKMISLWIEREAFASRLRVLGFAQIKEPYDLKKVFRLLAELKAKMTVFISLKGERGDTLKSNISEALSVKGFKLIDKSDDADVVITGKVTIEPVKVDNPDWEYARVSVALSVKDSITGKIAGEVSENKRAAQRTYKEAEEKGVRDISKAVEEKVLEFFEGNGLD